MSHDEPSPWWASDGSPGGVDPEVDPIEAHRAARRGRTCSDDDDTAGPADSGSSRPGPHADVCGVCPICTGMRVLGEARPELVEHLTEVVRHLGAAVRTLLEPPDTPRPPDAPGGDPMRPPRGVTRVDLD